MADLNELSFADKVKMSAIRPLLPMVRPACEAFFGSILENAQKQLRFDSGETEASIQCFKSGNDIVFCTVALNSDNRIVRMIGKYKLDEIISLITTKF